LLKYELEINKRAYNHTCSIETVLSQGSNRNLYVFCLFLVEFGVWSSICTDVDEKREREKEKRTISRKKRKCLLEKF
jgi:hypothetical protein